MQLIAICFLWNFKGFLIDFISIEESLFNKFYPASSIQSVLQGMISCIYSKVLNQSLHIWVFRVLTCTNTKKANSVALSPRVNYADWATDSFSIYIYITVILWSTSAHEGIINSLPSQIHRILHVFSVFPDNSVHWYNWEHSNDMPEIQSQLLSSEKERPN